MSDNEIYKESVAPPTDFEDVANRHDEEYQGVLPYSFDWLTEGGETYTNVSDYESRVPKSCFSLHAKALETYRDRKDDYRIRVIRVDTREAHVFIDLPTKKNPQGQALVFVYFPMGYRWVPYTQFKQPAVECDEYRRQSLVGPNYLEIRNGKLAYTSRSWRLKPLVSKSHGSSPRLKKTEWSKPGRVGALFIDTMLLGKPRYAPRHSHTAITGVCIVLSQDTHMGKKESTRPPVESIPMVGPRPNLESTGPIYTDRRRKPTGRPLLLNGLFDTLRNEYPWTWVSSVYTVYKNLGCLHAAADKLYPELDRIQALENFTREEKRGKEEHAKRTIESEVRDISASILYDILDQLRHAGVTEQVTLFCPNLTEVAPYLLIALNRLQTDNFEQIFEDIRELIGQVSVQKLEDEYLAVELWTKERRITIKSFSYLTQTEYYTYLSDCPEVYTNPWSCPVPKPSDSELESPGERDLRFRCFPHPLSDLKLKSYTSPSPQDDAILKYHTFLTRESSSLYMVMQHLNHHTVEETGLILWNYYSAAGLGFADLHKHSHLGYLGKIAEDSPDLYEWVAEGLYGGLNILLRSYSGPEAPIYVYDRRSAYPSIASSCIMPGRRVTELHLEKGQTLPLTDESVKKLALGLYTAKVTCTPNKPHPIVGVLPVRTNHGTYYPSPSCESESKEQSFSGVWTSMELALAHRCGYKIEILGGILFSPLSPEMKNHPFRDYYTTLYEARKKESNSLRASLLKLRMNGILGRLSLKLFQPKWHWITNLFGKEARVLGSQNEEFKKELSEVKSALKEYSKWDSGRVYIPSTSLIRPLGDKGGFVLVPEDEDTQSRTNVAIPAFINAYARVQLLELIIRLEEHGIKVYYADTDSVITSAPLPDEWNLVSDKMGAFKLELEADRDAGFMGLKNYVIRVDDTHAKIVHSGVSGRHREPEDRLTQMETDMVSRQIVQAKDLERVKKMYNKRTFISTKTDEPNSYPPTLKEMKEADVKLIKPHEKKRLARIADSQEHNLTTY